MSKYTEVTLNGKTHRVLVVKDPTLHEVSVVTEAIVTPHCEVFGMSDFVDNSIWHLQSPKKACICLNIPKYKDIIPTKKSLKAKLREKTDSI